MKESERLADGQIVRFKNQWLVAYKAAGANQLLLTFDDFMQIYNYGMTSSKVLNNCQMLSDATGVVDEISEGIESYIGGFAHKKDIIATDQRIEEFEA
jgi:hypothetical protein